MPSTQHSGNPAVGYIEGQTMNIIGELLAAKLEAAGALVSYHWSTSGDLDTLARLYREAQAWLDGRQELRRCIVSLHSDSSTWSHVFGLYGRDDDMILAALLAYGVADVLDVDPDKGVRVIDNWYGTYYSGYLFVTQTRSPSVLIEAGSHENMDNLAVLTSAEGQARIAGALRDGLIEWGKM